MLSERMRTWAKDTWEPNTGISVDELTGWDNQSVLIFAEEVAALEAQVGEPCSVCGQQPAVLVDIKQKATYWKCGDCVLEGIEEKMKLEAQVASLREALEGHDRQMLFAKAKRLKGTDGEGWAIGELVERILDGQ